MAPATPSLSPQASFPNTRALGRCVASSTPRRDAAPAHSFALALSKRLRALLRPLSLALGAKVLRSLVVLGRPAIGHLASESGCFTGRVAGKESGGVRGWG